jgi:hypothetical protein
MLSTLHGDLNLCLGNQALAWKLILAQPLNKSMSEFFSDKRWFYGRCSYNQGQFDSKKPYGEYDLNMSLVRSRSILLHLMKLVYAGTASFAPGMTLCDKDHSTRSIISAAYTLDVGRDISGWAVPEQGFLHFNLAPTNNYGADSDDHKKLERRIEEFLRNQTDTAERIKMIKRHFVGQYSKAAYRHVVWLLSLLGKLSVQDESRANTLQEERISVIVSAFDNIARPKYKHQLLGLLNSEERSAAENQLGIVPFQFLLNNLTGFYRLKLSKVGEREIAIQLMERRAALKRDADKQARHMQGRKGGDRSCIERIWRNAKHITHSLFKTNITELGNEELDLFRIPFAGFLEVDFVDICKPNQKNNQTSAMSPLEFAAFLRGLKNKSSSQDRLVEIRRISSIKYFNCLQAVALIELFENISTKERYSRVEVAVCLFSRIIDWRGYKHVLGHVGAALAADVEYRIGRRNIYHDETASPIGWWALDLELEEDRWIMQELIHLAYCEPGNKMIDCTMDDCPFDVSMDWLLNVPRYGRVSLFYCRTVPVTEKCLHFGPWISEQTEETARWSAQFPPSFEVAKCSEGDVLTATFTKGVAKTWTWTDMERIRIVADILRLHSKHAVEMFSQIDTDGGGEISPAEFSSGLFRLGIWLPPNHLKLLFFYIDFNGDGDISCHEFCQFWIHAPPLRRNDAEQKAYWSFRGIQEPNHDALVKLYDVRTWYPPDLLTEYRMNAAQYTLMPQRSPIVKTAYDSATQLLVVTLKETKSPS